MAVAIVQACWDGCGFVLPIANSKGTVAIVHAGMAAVLFVHSRMAGREATVVATYAMAYGHVL